MMKRSKAEERAWKSHEDRIAKINEEWRRQMEEAKLEHMKRLAEIRENTKVEA